MFDFIKWMNEFFPPNHPVPTARNQKRFIPQIEPLDYKGEPDWTKNGQPSYNHKVYTLKEIWEEYCEIIPLKTTWRITFYKVVNKGALEIDSQLFIQAVSFQILVKILSRKYKTLRVVTGDGFTILKTDRYPVITVEEMPF